MEAKDVDLGWVLAEEKEHIGSIGGGNAGVEIAGAGEGDVVGGEGASGDIHGENVVLDGGWGKGGEWERAQEKECEFPCSPG